MSSSVKRKHVSGVFFVTYHHSVEAQSFDNRVLLTFQKYCLSFTKRDECQLAPLTVDRKYDKWNFKDSSHAVFIFLSFSASITVLAKSCCHSKHRSRNTQHMGEDEKWRPWPNVINTPSLPLASYSLTITDDIQLYWISWPWCFCSEIRGEA